MAGRRVLDVASGSGLCAIVAARSGARSVRAVDIDPLSQAAVALNARVNRVHVGFTRTDPPSESPPPCDVILAGDVCYEQTMGSRIDVRVHARLIEVSASPSRSGPGRASRARATE